MKAQTAQGERLRPRKRTVYLTIMIIPQQMSRVYMATFSAQRSSYSSGAMSSEVPTRSTCLRVGSGANLDEVPRSSVVTLPEARWRSRKVAANDVSSGLGWIYLVS